NLGPAERLRVELVPGAAARKARDRLREVVLRPGRLTREELLAAVVDPARAAAVELSGGDEVLLRHGARHRTAVELVESRRELGSPSPRKVESVPFGPRIRPGQQAALARQPNGKPAGRE